jgi:diketogulonate reductase-like aldo/keto reductase
VNELIRDALYPYPAGLRLVSKVGADRDIAYVPFFPIGGPGPLARDPTISAIAAKHGATPAQIALAWLLYRDEHVLLIPGTSSVTHLEHNTAAAGIALDDEDMAALDRLPGLHSLDDTRDVAKRGAAPR